jgi:hypothetical protein
VLWFELQSVLIRIHPRDRRLRIVMDFVVLSSKTWPERSAGVPAKTGSATAPMGWKQEGL